MDAELIERKGRQPDEAGTVSVQTRLIVDVDSHPAPSCESRPTGAGRRRRGWRRLISLEPVVCGNDSAHQLVPDNVVIGQVTEGDVLDVVQNSLHHAKTAPGAAGQVYLCDVTRHHDLGAESQPGQKHLHLLHRGVLSLVQDRKSTRLNSSHANISYAVFCLKKKKKQ